MIQKSPAKAKVPKLDFPLQLQTKMPKEVQESIKSLYDDYVQFFLDESVFMD